MKSVEASDHFGAGRANIFILKADRVYAEALHQAARDVFPEARFQIVSRLKETQASLDDKPADLITDMDIIDGDVLDLLGGSANETHRFRHMFVINNQWKIRFLIDLKTLPIDGVFDSGSEDLAHFTLALRTIATGQTYWSPSVLEQLRLKHALPNAFWHWLTPTEQLVLAVIGDGCDDEVAARYLGMKPSAVQSVRRSLHRKLDLQHKSDLVKFAMEQGFVRFGLDGVMRPGFLRLLAACPARQRRLIQP